MEVTGAGTDLGALEGPGEQPWLWRAAKVSSWVSSPVQVLVLRCCRIISFSWCPG